MIPDDEMDALSRTLARFFTGEDRLFSALAYERRLTSWQWFVLRVIIDRKFMAMRGERCHCRNAHIRERQERAEMLERLRVAGL